MSAACWADGRAVDGDHLWGAFGLLAEMIADRRSGSVVTLLADSGDRYADTYFCDEWLTSHEARSLGAGRGAGRIRAFGRWPDRRSAVRVV